MRASNVRAAEVPLSGRCAGFEKRASLAALPASGLVRFSALARQKAGKLSCLVMQLRRNSVARELRGHRAHAPPLLPVDRVPGTILHHCD